MRPEIGTGFRPSKYKRTVTILFRVQRETETISVVRFFYRGESVRL